MFWEQYASAAASACMPSNSLFAMDKARSILGQPSDFEKKYGQILRTKIVEVNSAGTYSNNDLWSYTEGDKYIFTSRPLGMMVSVYPDWSLNISNFEKKKATFMMVSPEITSRNGQVKTYTISITAKVTTEDDDLRTFLHTLVPPNAAMNEIVFSIKYPTMVSYEVGSRMYLIGVKRKQPKYPGLELEKPLSLPNTSNKLEEFCSEKVKNRFGGILFYAVLLDASEDIFPLAISSFRNIFENLITFE